MITAIIDAGQHYCQAVSDLWQWDYGQTLRIQGVKLPAAVEVQFSTTERIGETVTRIGVTQEGVTEVPIPDTLLEGSGTTQDYTIYAFVYIENGDSGKTEYRVSMKVRARPKPEAHATPEEGELFRQAIVAVAESADRAESARKSAETASDQAEDAKNAAEAAVGSAQASADEAKTAKANAKTAVKNAEAFKTEAETARSEAVRADKYYPFGYEYSIITKDVSELKTRKSENRLHGKTMAILGDSMAKGHTLNEKQTWAYKIANRNGMTYQKLAVNGMFITTGHGDADANCLLEQAKKINNNPDIIVIHMGTNDRNNNVELGTWTIRNTDTTNLFGALRVAFTYLEENFPLAQVMFITPYYYQEQTDYIGSIEKACMYVGCHCKNNKQGGICAWNTNVRNALFLDYVHLNEVGQERVSYEYEGFMRTFM